MNRNEAIKRAVEFIALNDEPTDFEEDSIAYYLSTICASTALQIPQHQLAQKILRLRRKEKKERAINYVRNARKK